MTQSPELLNSYSHLIDMINTNSQNNQLNSHQKHQKNCKDINCFHCDQLKRMLESAEKKYMKLLSQNYVGELTIHYLKEKNKELLHKICKNQKEISKKREKFFMHKKLDNLIAEDVSNIQKYCDDKQIFIQTFNPCQLKKILSQSNSNNNNTQNDQNKQNTFSFQQNKISCNPSRIMSTKQNSTIDDNNCIKKPFNLNDLKRKAQLRLIELRKDHELKKTTCSQKISQQAQQFKFY